MIIKFIAIPLMLLSSVPQIIKIYNTKNVQGISFTMYVMTAIAVSLLLFEGVRVSSKLIIISESCSLSMLTITILMILKYKKNK